MYSGILAGEMIHEHRTKALTLKAAREDAAADLKRKLGLPQEHRLGIVLKPYEVMLLVDLLTDG